MGIDSDRMVFIQRKIRESRKDKLLEFVMHPLIEELTQMQTKNLENLFSLCRANGVRYIWLSSNEMCGCENITCEQGRPVMWCISDQLGLKGLCGNRDQRQFDSGPWFAEDHYGAYDLLENRRLTYVEVVAMKFNQVCHR